MQGVISSCELAGQGGGVYKGAEGTTATEERAGYESVIVVQENERWGNPTAQPHI
jgi:hypothetical protein